jgi:hypothetical protein
VAALPNPVPRADPTTTRRNGTKESLKTIVKGLNEAKLDSNVGMLALYAKGG